MRRHIERRFAPLEGRKALPRNEINAPLIARKVHLDGMHFSFMVNSNTAMNSPNGKDKDDRKT